jgi:hypothetical protein
MDLKAERQASFMVLTATLKIKQLSKKLKEMQLKKGNYDEKEYNVFGIWKPPEDALKLEKDKSEKRMRQVSMGAVSIIKLVSRKRKKRKGAKKSRKRKGSKKSRRKKKK